MDLAALRQQILSSSKTANEKAEDLLLESKVNELSKDEWRELIAGIPADVKKEIGRLKSAGTQLHLHMTGSRGQQEVYRKAAAGVQENSCQSVVLQTVVADLTATRTSVQRVCGLYNDACACAAASYSHLSGKLLSVSQSTTYDPHAALTHIQAPHKTWQTIA